MRLFVSILLPCVLFCTPVEAQITSVAGGGSWWETATWIGGQVPTASDDVIVNGPVIVRGDDTCRDLTVNAAGSVQNTPNRFS
ncbi:hypothetical protein ACFLRO_01740, partial [Bacteroidota bacterium]